MIVGDKRTVDDTVLLAANGRLGRTKSQLSSYLEAKLARRVARTGVGFYSPASFGQFNPARDVHVRAADVVCLYWINGGFVRPEGLTGLSQPLVWRLSDIWPFSGGCHYPGGCERFTERCGTCPQLADQGKEDRSRRLWQRKVQAWRDIDLTIAAPSQWIAELAARSSIFSGRRIVVIPTGVDLNRYRPVGRTEARARFGIPQDKLVILFGAVDPSGDIRKGYLYLHSALDALSRGASRYRLLAVVFGEAPPLGRAVLPVPAVFLGHLTDDESLAAAYSAADVVVVPSMEDNLPNVAIEAIACGTPVVAFKIGGMPDIVEHMQNGYLVDSPGGGGLADGIEWVLAEGGRWNRLCENARAAAERKFSMAGQVDAYFRLYQELIASDSKGSSESK